MKTPVIRYKIFLDHLEAYCDIHARYDASGPAWIGVYDRMARRWYTTLDGTLTPFGFVAALRAIEGRS